MATSARAAQPHIDAFAKSYDFPLDDFQLRACQAVAVGQGVLLAAPTGAGKTIVGEFEVLRNMMYAGSATLRGLGFVVMDEVHYLADRLRGAVWEEVIIHLPEDVQVVSLSATVSNAEEFGAWLGEV